MAVNLIHCETIELNKILELFLHVIASLVNFLNQFYSDE